jgi:hypothetical protein
MDESMTPERFAELLRASYLAADERLRAEFQRSLSFQDAMFDRWERARRLGFAPDTSIYNSAAVLFFSKNYLAFLLVLPGVLKHFMS